MKIRTQFIINIVVLGSILIFVSAAVIVTNQWVENTHRQQELAARIEHEAYELGYLANDYLLYRESQQASRWESKFASFSDHLSKLEVDTPEQQALLASIETNQQRLKAVFEEVKAQIEASLQTPETRVDEKFMQISWDRLAVQNQGMIFSASRLEGMLNEQEHWLEQFARLLSLGFIAMLGVFLLVNYGLNFQRILHSLADLQTGTRIIGSGNLDFAIDVKSDDEIGELSHAFNQMTGKLKTITTSRAELEREIRERKQAEEALRESEAHYRGVVESQLDLIVRVDLKGCFTFANDAYCRKFGLKREEILGKESYQQLVHPEDLPHTLEAMKALYQPPYRALVEQRAFAVEGIRWIEWQDSAIRNGAGNVVEIQAIGRDITERKQAEEALRRSEALLLQTGKMAKVGGWELDLQTMTLHWSEETYRIHEVDPSLQPDLENAINYYGPEARPVISAAVQQAIEESQPYDLELPFITAKGKKLWIHTMGQPEFREGKCVRLFGTFQDITERKQAEEALRESEQRLTRAQEIAHLGSWELDLVTNELTWSDEVYRIFGLQPQEFAATYEAFLEAVHTEDRAAVNDAYSGSIREGRDSYEIEHRVVRRSTGEIRIVHEKCEHFRDQDGQIIRSVGMVHDITERKRAEAEIASLAKFPTENPNPILRVQTDGRLIYANAASRELLDEWECEVNNYLPEEFRDFITVAVNDNLNKTVDVFCKDKVYSIMLVPIVEAGYVNIYGREVTERKRAEEALKHLAEDLRRSNAELEQFAYVASHDLQEPLRMVSSYMQLLKRRYQGKLDNDADEFIAFAVDGAARMQQLINDLLTFSRVGTRGRLMGLSSCEKILAEALMNLQVAIEESKATITHDPLPTVFCDQPQLVQVFQNLLGNSIKFRGQQASKIHISAKRAESEWIFSVCDNGIGLDPKFGERIFEIFQRLHSRTAYPGTGIGLAICKRIVQRHGGRIWVESKPGEGSTFYFTLPVKETS